MEDVQSRRDHRRIPIDLVGVSGIRYPITVLDRAQTVQHTVATLAMSVSLPHHFKGTHMSRFIEVLNAHRGELTMRTLPALLGELRSRLSAEKARVEVTFPYFLEKAAPATGAVGLMDYECTFVGELNGKGDDFVLSVRVPVTTLCPCSKEISDYGAHNQRSFVTMEVRTSPVSGPKAPFVWIEELIAVAEGAASAPVYPLVKRPDERHITMQAFDKPVFVEDVVRDVAAQLKADRRVGSFRVHALNLESIHNHDAFAEIEWNRANTESRRRAK